MKLRDLSHWGLAVTRCHVGVVPVLVWTGIWRIGCESHSSFAIMTPPRLLFLPHQIIPILRTLDTILPGSRIKNISAFLKLCLLIYYALSEELCLLFKGKLNLKSEECGWEVGTSVN